MMEKLVHAMTRVELGHDIDAGAVHRGVAMAMAMAMGAAGRGMAPAVPAAGSQFAGGGVDRSVHQTNNIVVHGATDPQRTGQQVQLALNRVSQDLVRSQRDNLR
jgi:hypothetical protein